MSTTTRQPKQDSHRRWGPAAAAASTPSSGHFYACALLLAGLSSLAGANYGGGGGAGQSVAGLYQAPAHEMVYPLAPDGPHLEPQQQHCVLTISTQAAPAASSSGANSSYSSSYLTDYYAATSSRVGATAELPYHATGGDEQLQQPQEVCLSQLDIDQAVEEARACFSHGGQLPGDIYATNSEQPQPMQVAQVAEIVAQATRILANRHRISESSILYDLPGVDVGKSRALAKLCPTFLRPEVNCDPAVAGPFRTLTGYCNNLQYPSWGATRSAMVRFLAPDYYDSISLPRRAYDGSPLPSARVVSFVVHQDPPEVLEQRHSMLSVVWGQFIDHDMTLAVQATDEMQAQQQQQQQQQQVQPKSLDAGDSNNKLDCCASETTHPDCFPIEIPKGDPFFGYFDKRCMHFTRATPGLQPGCSLGPVQAMNKLSSYMDGNLIYGSTTGAMQRLRAFRGGQLRSQPADSRKAFGTQAAATGAAAAAGAATSFQPLDGNSLLQAEYLVASGGGGAVAGGYATAPPPPPAAAGHFKELLPSKVDQPDSGCERRGRPSDVFCFEAGDPRANEQIQLTTMHTLFMREHNRLAGELAHLNPHWDDERLFQVARQLVVAQLQHITLAEFLPLVIGRAKVHEYGLELAPAGTYYRGYDAKINAGIRVEFQAAAFRYGHSILPGHIERYNKYHQRIESIRLSKLLKQPYDLYHPGVLDSYLLGLTNQRAGRMDPTLTTELTNHLFERPGNFFGIDLAAINIQRGRDMGVPGYNHFREYCGLPRARHFDDLLGAFSNKTLLRLAQLYKHVDDIDLWTAGISEYPVQDGGLVGPTFACLIARQFVNLRRGDRFWYENGGPAGAQFTLEQLDELRRASSAQLICDNSDDIETIQARPMLVADRHSNPLVPCASLARIDLTRWRDPVVGGYEAAAAAAAAETAAASASSNSYPTVARSLVEATASAIVGGAHPMAAELAANDFEPVRASSHQFVNHHLVSAASYRPELGAAARGRG